MKTRAEVSADKLRGGFYTPDPLVDLCFERIHELVGDRRGLRVLEPTAGDGAFVRGLARSPIRAAVDEIVALERDVIEAAKADSARHERGLAGVVHAESILAWGARTEDEFDVAVGNPPFVRFQFVDPDDQHAARALAARLDVSLAGVSNLWVPALLAALGRLRQGGAFAFVVPTECLTGVSPRIAREWLSSNARDLRFDLFAPGSFPRVLQEVTVLSGRRCAPRTGATTCTVHEPGRTPARHALHPTHRSWTRLLLSPREAAAYDTASALPTVRALGELATFEVAAVTGANDFFTVDDATVAAFGLAPWARPLVPRIRHAGGLRYTNTDHHHLAASGAKSHLLDFGAERPDPTVSPTAAAYLRSGVDARLPLRYKCRIREPWYRVPAIRAGELMLSKRSHRFPRVVLNEAGVLTTDTIYRGAARGRTRAVDVAATFHNSLTLLSCELEGRSFGGGVLELVPSEIARLAMPDVPGFGDELDRLDTTARQGGDDALIDDTDTLLMKWGVAGFDPELLDVLAAARRTLMQRRLARG